MVCCWCVRASTDHYKMTLSSPHPCRALFVPMVVKIMLFGNVNSLKVDGVMKDTAAQASVPVWL